MKKKILIVFGIILAIIVILYLPIPIGKDIMVNVSNTTNAPSLDGGRTFIPSGNLAPSKYVINKFGFVYEDGRLVKVINLINKVELIMSKDKEKVARKLVK